MSRILAYTSPARGHLFPAVPILDELQRRGHEIAVRTLGSEVDWLLERGFDAAPMNPTIEQIKHDDYLGRTPMASIKRSVAVFAQRATHDAADLRLGIDEVDPAFLLVDVNSWGAAATAEASGIPWAMWCPYPLPLPSKDTPPFGPGMPPARGPMGRLRDAALRPLISGPVDRAMLPGVNGVRSPMGLPPIDDAGALFAGCPLLLYLTAEPFEYHRTDWPPNVRMVGPSAWDPPAETPAWLDDIDRPLVLVTTSSEFQDDGHLAEVALEALADEDVHVVMTMPSASQAGLRAPSNTHVVTFVPHGPILERAVCAVTHGGMGATQKALSKGVPVCAVPFGRDQFEVARRVEVAGAGVRLPAKRLSPHRLRDAVRRAISLKDGALRIAEAFRDAGGAERAADLVENQLASRSLAPRHAGDPA